MRNLPSPGRYGRSQRELLSMRSSTLLVTRLTCSNGASGSTLLRTCPRQPLITLPQVAVIKDPPLRGRIWHVRHAACAQVARRIDGRICALALAALVGRSASWLVAQAPVVHP